MYIVFLVEEYAKVKLNFTLGEAIKAQRESTGTLYSFFNFGSRWGWVGPRAILDGKTVCTAHKSLQTYFHHHMFHETSKVVKFLPMPVNFRGFCAIGIFVMHFCLLLLLE